MIIQFMLSILTEISMVTNSMMSLYFDPDPANILDLGPLVNCIQPRLGGSPATQEEEKIMLLYKIVLMSCGSKNEY